MNLLRLPVVIRVSSSDMGRIPPVTVDSLVAHLERLGKWTGLQRYDDIALVLEQFIDF